MKPLLTIVIPCYNGEPFLEKSIHSLINDRVLDEVSHLFEVIVIDDGSKDHSIKLAKQLSSKWNKIVRKDFIRIISKANGQYGSVINMGIKQASGVYFKVLDVDDTFNTRSFVDLLHIINGFEKHPDVIFTDHVFEKIGSDSREVQSLADYFPANKIIKLSKQPFPKDLITMHSVIYRLNLLQNINYKQIEGVYYSDSQYSLIPLLEAKSMYYIEMPLYRYYIGRNEQSINMKVMVRNRLHQRAVLIKIFEDIKFVKTTSQYTKKYTLLVARRMIQWQALLIANDKSVERKRIEIIKLLEECKKLQPEVSNEIFSGLFFAYIKISKGFGLPFFIKHGIKIYSKFKKNILAEWD